MATGVYSSNNVYTFFEEYGHTNQRERHTLRPAESPQHSSAVKSMATGVYSSNNVYTFFEEYVAYCSRARTNLATKQPSNPNGYADTTQDA